MTRKFRRKRLIAVVAVVTMLALSAGCQPEQIALNSDLKIGSTFPGIEGTDIHGQPISMEDFKGKVVLLDFFGDW